MPFLAIRFPAVFALFLLLCAVSLGQNADPRSPQDTTRSDTGRIRIAPADTLRPGAVTGTIRDGDTTRIILSPGTEPVQVGDTAQPFVPTKTPMLAVGLSALLPGAGQIYNEDYWKVPVVWGLGGYWVYEWIYNNRQYQDYRRQYEQSLIELPGQGDGFLERSRDFYRDERDKFAWYLGVLYLANLVDAYVSAHLYDFDVSPDLSAVPGRPPQMGLAVRYRW